MWIMTPFGILMPSQRPARTIKAGDERKLQIRVRDRKALEYLREHYMQDELGQIIATPKMDYNFRAYCEHEDFATAVARMTLEIDYEKFKPESVDNDLHDLYNEIWFDVYKHYQATGSACTVRSPQVRTKRRFHRPSTVRDHADEPK